MCVRDVGGCVYVCVGLVGGGVGVSRGVWVGVCVGGCLCAFAILSFRIRGPCCDNTPIHRGLCTNSEDLYLRPRKTLAKKCRKCQVLPS